MKKIIALVIVLVLAICSIGFGMATRIATAVQTSSGGTDGTTKGAGYMNYTNSSSAGKDNTTASTSSNAKGTVKVVAKVHYTDGSGNQTKEARKTNANSTYAQASATVPSGLHGYMSSSSHSYSSPEYGSWSASLSKDY